jgi:predicted nucleic acid-binding protein
MGKYAIDASAWIEYLEGSTEGEKVGEIIEKENNESFTSSITLAEVISRFIRKDKDYEIAKKAVYTLSKIVFVDDVLGEKAAKIHAKIKMKDNRFSLADAFVEAMAESMGLTVVTKDLHFKHFRNVVFVNK